jgi:hypothetical protein
MNDKLVKTIAEIGLERLEECSRIVGSRFLPSVRVCFGVDARDQPDAFGSCFLLRVEGRSFLVTAAHVIDENAHTTIYVGGGNKLVQLEAKFLATEKPGDRRGADHYDFAFTELSEEQCADLAADTLIDERQVSANQAPSANRAYMTLGFPATMQKVVWKKPIVRTESWTFIGFDRPDPDLAKRLSVSGADHFFIVHDKRVLTFSGNRQNAVKPQGASGGVLIDMGPFDPEKLRPDSPCIGLLAGLLIEHHSDARRIVAVRIQMVLDQIAKYLGQR